jgi:hypothetical protein
VPVLRTFPPEASDTWPPTPAEKSAMVVWEIGATVSTQDAAVDTAGNAVLSPAVSAEATRS